MFIIRWLKRLFHKHDWMTIKYVPQYNGDEAYFKQKCTKCPATRTIGEGEDG